MIKPNELRLGNFVKDRGGKILKIDFFEYLENGYDCKFGQHNKMSDEWGALHPLTEYTNFAEPIPLTPEILEKFGFVLYESNTIYFYNNGIRLYWRKRNNEFFYRVGTMALKIKSVHQLQNLYIALTGEEMDVKM